MIEKIDSTDDTFKYHIDSSTGIDNMSALTFHFFSRKINPSIAFGAEFKKFDFAERLLTFKLEKLDKNMFLDYYKTLPVDEHKKFKIKLEYQND